MENKCPVCKARFSSLRRKTHRVEYAAKKKARLLKLIPDKDQSKGWHTLLELLQSAQTLFASEPGLVDAASRPRIAARVVAYIR